MQNLILRNKWYWIPALALATGLIIGNLTGCATAKPDQAPTDCLPLAVQKCETFPASIWHQVLIVEYAEDGVKAAHAFCAFDLGDGYVWLWDRKGSTETFMHPTAKLDGLAFMGLWSRGMFKKDLTEIKKVRFVEREGK